jgi:competence protein ComEA
MKGCLDYTKEASTHRLRLPNLSKRGQILLIALVVALVIAALWLFWPNDDAQGFEVLDAESAATEAETENSADEGTSTENSGEATEEPGGSLTTDGAQLAEGATTPLVVYVSGAVVSPGVYELKANARVDDGVRAAGGLREDAAAEAVNLAAMLEDGMQVHIPTHEELASGQTLAPGATTAASAAGLAQTPSTQTQGGLVNINTADMATLETLPGIGPATAQRIIAYREAKGAFSSIEELRQVSGIGEKKYAALVDLICV